ncbi:MAG: peptidoglycan-binding protein [Patescibacteria group bacterium]|nr:peptidoglycan-binding protein [Patescibacteria group bacterium]MDE2218011.1 peptidoglycan-binding protein [Patescibacteria group bacterium]
MGIFDFKKPFLFFVFLSVFSIIFFFYLSAKDSFALSDDKRQNSFFFTKDLKIGDTNEDVRILQRVLNGNPETEVSSYGEGSSGNETVFFGTLTKNAVVKFQELYASDILRPLGLQKGTGFVGITTRLKLNSLIGEGDTKKQSFSSGSQSASQSANSKDNGSASSVSVESSSGAVFSKSPFEAPGVRVYNTSEYQIKPGAMISVAGEGFAPTANIIHLGDGYVIKDIKADGSSSLSFIFPKDLPIGEYGIWVENENGTSKNQGFDVFFLVTNTPVKRPIIGRVSPSVALLDEEITLSGSGFASDGNNIYSSFGNIFKLPSSDGRTLKFKASSLSEIYRLQKVANIVKGKNLKGWLYVESGNGTSKDPTEFSIKI